jgi:ribosomal protein L31E
MPRQTGSKNLPKYRYRVEVAQEDEENDVYYFCNQEDICKEFKISRITVTNRIKNKFSSRGMKMKIEKLANPRPAVRIERTMVEIEYDD